MKLAMEYATKRSNKYTGGLLTMFTGDFNLEWECIYATDFEGLDIPDVPYKPIKEERKQIFGTKFNGHGRVSLLNYYHIKTLDGIQVYIPIGKSFDWKDLFIEGSFGNQSKYPLFRGSNFMIRKQNPSTTNIIILEPSVANLQVPVCFVRVKLFETSTVGEIRRTLHKLNILHKWNLENISGRALTLVGMEKNNLDDNTKQMFELGVCSCPDKEKLLWDAITSKVQIDRVQETQKLYTFNLAVESFRCILTFPIITA